MTKTLRIVLAQLNLTVGDINGNLKKHIAAAIKARDELAADVIVFSELGIIGYPTEDLLFREEFLADAQAALDKFITEVQGIYCVIGHPAVQEKSVYNACSLIYDGKVIGQYAKQHLPNYEVFDEQRYFTSGKKPCVLSIKGVPVGLIICEDLWRLGPTREAAAQGAKLILVPNASPFEIDKHEQRMSVLTKRASFDQVPIVYVNQVCGQDELVFDGGSMVVDADGNLCQHAGFFAEKLLAVDIDFSANKPQINKTTLALPPTEEIIYEALKLGLRDYVTKNHFPGVVIGLSGGIDSALTLAIAVDALGKDKVRTVTMPSRYTADISTLDAIEIANNFGVQCDTISIEPTYKAFLESLQPVFKDKKPDVTEENIQARCRAVILMALSNKFGYLVLTTGNRSELAVGYCTLYGDMAGGYAVLKDIPKTFVFQLAKYRNQISPVIPQRTIDRPPTAELAFDQKDEDTLPPYSVLDEILFWYLNHGESIAAIVQRGFAEEVVTRVVKMVKRSEYKRRQAVVGPRVNHKSFGKDWRYPITNGYLK